MKRLIALTACAAAVFGCTAASPEPVELADPMTGTGFHGHTFPGAAYPYGMVQLSPDTRTEGWDACSGYHYSDNEILGFSHTHLSGTGCADLADILFYPAVGGAAIEDGLFSRPPYRFSHSDETARCGYYSVDFKNGIKAELTATEHAGVHRYSFSGKGGRHILIDLLHAIGDDVVDESSIEAVSGDEITGHRRTQGWVEDHYVFFSAKFSEPFSEVSVIDGKQALVTFPESTRSVSVAVGLSGVSTDNARENRLAEAPDADFDAAEAAARKKWSEELGAVRVKGGSKRDLKNFYTALYHTKLCPNVMSDVNGEYRASDGTIARVPEGRKYYSTFSLWDTYRAWNPLQTLLDTAFVSDMVRSMLDMYDRTGELPIWPLASGETRTMIGYHAVSVIADAYLRGIGGFDPEHALEAMVRSSNINRKGSEYYTALGYVPANMKPESVSLTLEYSYDDWTVARMAEALGKKDIAEEYYRRAGNYVNVFDGVTSFFRGRGDDNCWTEPFDIFSTGRDYTEATPWHYRFAVPHDVRGMEQLFGGKEKFVRALDDLFTVESDASGIALEDVTGLMGQYAHGNEPSHHMAYLYCYEGMPWRTCELTRKLLDEMYSPSPEGIIGNEDCGQMSAWYVLSAMGFYPVCPGSGQFVLTSPLFEEAAVSLAGGKTLTIKAEGARRNKYAGEVRFNGESIPENWISYDRLMGGGELEFKMLGAPDRSRGASAEAAPYSMTRGEFVSMPYTDSKLDLFKGQTEIRLYSATDDACVRYTLDGSEPDGNSELYASPFVVDDSAVIKAKAFKEGMQDSKTVVFNAVKAEFAPAAAVSGLVPGVAWTYRTGRFASVAEMAAAPVAASGTMPVPSIADASDEDRFGYVFTGYIDVPERDVWEFTVKSDDGSVLFVDGVKIVNNDGSHAAVSASGRIALDKGLHPFTLLYFEDYEGEELSWAWRRDGTKEFSEIPASALFHLK